MGEVLAGFPAPMPFGTDFVTYSNEDLGVTTAFAAGADVKQFPLPYPSSMNLWEESMMLFCMESIYHGIHYPTATLTTQGIIQHLSMLADDFGANWGGQLADAEDEAFKSQFAGPDYFGQRSVTLLGAANTLPFQVLSDQVQNVKYFPSEPLDLVTPLYVNWTNAGATVTLATGASVLDDDSAPQEFLAIRVWFLKRDYTTAEKQWLNRLPTRFQQLDS